MNKIKILSIFLEMIKMIFGDFDYGSEDRSSIDWIVLFDDGGYDRKKARNNEEKFNLIQYVKEKFEKYFGGGKYN
jgi:hypothetical protein